ncbi:PREDICTED: uncharacterized protein LOC105461348 isoform X2 [Wasmannia auropunctata]|uniref:uncharacterized protein LOC105461348 isoform X2 n=1 Tax=Wasmannia auropunctata TaxID=64793 RepID=UPI0005EEBC8F|nr:PREDICTED: uncharacterized protein LOC105461348 isoform X2 [Wasmannia auropunctata]
MIMKLYILLGFCYQMMSVDSAGKLLANLYFAYTELFFSITDILDYKLQIYKYRLKLIMKKISKQTDLSSSEDEDISILKEAIDQEFFTDNLYSTRKAKVISQSANTNKLDENYSLRTSSKEDKFTNFGVTATFQSFIAKKLDEILDRTIELESSETINCCGKQRQRKHNNFGIKLLNTSKKLLTVKVGEEYTEKEKRSKRNRQIAEDDEALSKFREAAIDAEYILSQVDTKAWVNKRPEPEFKYKRLKNGTLIEM